MTNAENREQTNNQQLEQESNLIDENYDFYYDPPRGWSYICLSETINYYSNYTNKRKTI